jgi:hypothetical protein
LENPKRRKVGAIAGKQKPSKQSQCHCCCLFLLHCRVVFLRLLKIFPSDFLVSSLLMLSKLHVNPSPLHVCRYPIFPTLFCSRVWWFVACRICTQICIHALFLYCKQAIVIAVAGVIIFIVMLFFFFLKDFVMTC